MRITATILTVLITFAGQAQIDINKYVNMKPPNVSSFEKYGNVPINYSTGQVSYTIPLYSFEIDDRLKIPIELNYANAGLKPNEIPSWVGNGWDLLPRGYIT
jgi:hypothetical protein